MLLSGVLPLCSIGSLRRARRPPRLHRPALRRGDTGLDNVRDGVEPLVVPGEDARPELVAGVRRDLAMVVARDGAEEHVVAAFWGGVGFGGVVEIEIDFGCRRAICNGAAVLHRFRVLIHIRLLQVRPRSRPHKIVCPLARKRLLHQARIQMRPALVQIAKVRAVRLVQVRVALQQRGARRRDQRFEQGCRRHRFRLDAEVI